MSIPLPSSDHQKLLHPNILLVKLSSLGDVLHNLPIVWDLRSRFPAARIDWVVEEAYVHLLKPLRSTAEFRGIDRIIPFGLRRWKRQVFKRQSWDEFFTFKHALQEVTYDYVIETQGLIKSALVCALAKKAPGAIVAGLGNATQFSGYEPQARMFYTQSVQVPQQCHAIDRSRWVMSSALDCPLIGRDEAPRFYPTEFVNSISATQVVGLEKPYILFFHSTARAAKRWPDEDWITLGNALSRIGYQIVLPWGTEAEKAVSQTLCKQIPGSLVPNRFSIEEAFSVIHSAALTIGVDTGLTHLAAVLGRPTVEIYCDSPQWKTAGYWSKQIINLGDMQRPPNTKDVLTASLQLLA